MQKHVYTIVIFPWEGTTNASLHFAPPVWMGNSFQSMQKPNPQRPGSLAGTKSRRVPSAKTRAASPLGLITEVRKPKATLQVLSFRAVLGTALLQLAGPQQGQRWQGLGACRSCSFGRGI